MDIFLIVAILVGLGIYGFTDGKLSEVGRLVFASAFLAFCLRAAPHLLRLTT